MPVEPPPENIIFDIIGSSTIITRRVEIYESDGITLWNGVDPTSSRIVAGSVGVSYGNDVRRTLDLELDNTDGALNNNPSTGLWYDKIIKCYRGIIGTVGLWECQVGEFMIDGLVSSSFPHTMKITGRDYVKKCQQSKFTKTVTFSSGASLESVIGSIAANAGCTKQLLPITGQTLGKDFTFDRGSSRWDAMIAMTDAYGYEIFFDATGYLVIREYLDPVLSPIEFSFQTGAMGTLVSVERSTNDSQLYNHVLVTGDNSDPNITNAAAEAFNTEPGSPTSIDKIGDRLYTYSSSFITTTDQAQDVAKKFLQVHALEQYNMSINAIVLPWLEVGGIVEIIETVEEAQDTNIPTRYLLDGLTIPLGLDAMSATGKRVTIITDDGSTQDAQSSQAARFTVDVGAVGGDENG